MNLKEEIIEYRKESGSLSGLSTKTDLYFLEKYGINSSKKDGYDYDGVLVPGNIYFFTYETDSRISEKVKFINRNPLILYISSEKVGDDIIVKSIDLSITPPDKRIDILQSFCDKFSSTLDRNQKETSKKGRPEEIRLSSKDLPSLFAGSGYNYSFTGFKFRFFKDIKFVDYSDWHKIPFLKYTSIQGMSVNEIYTDYRSKLKG